MPGNYFPCFVRFKTGKIAGRRPALKVRERNLVGMDTTGEVNYHGIGPARRPTLILQERVSAAELLKPDIVAHAMNADPESGNLRSRIPSERRPQASELDQVSILKRLEIPDDNPQGICPLCRGAGSRLLFTATDRLYRTTSRKFQIVECTQCGLIRLSPQPAPQELRSYYPADYWFSPTGETVSRLEEFYRRLVVRDHVEFVRRAVASSGESGSVLDVGCGGGLFLGMFRQQGYMSVGLDANLEAARVAWRNNGVPTVCASLIPSPFLPGSCAAITMFHVLEHLYDPQSYLEAARALLKPNGRLIVQVPNADCWQFLLLREGWSGLDVPRHLLTLRAQDLERLLDRAGFEILERKHFSLRDNPAGFATSLAPWLDPMARRIRRIPESQWLKLSKSLFYFCLVVACLPLAALEAACRAGSTIMVEARKKP